MEKKLAIKPMKNVTVDVREDGVLILTYEKDTMLDYAVDMVRFETKDDYGFLQLKPNGKLYVSRNR